MNCQRAFLHFVRIIEDFCSCRERCCEIQSARRPQNWGTEKYGLPESHQQEIYKSAKNRQIFICYSRIFFEAKREMKRLHDEHVKETSEGNAPIHPVQRSRQRRNQQFEGLEENDYQIDAQTGWRTYPSKSQGNLSRNPTHSSSSIQWEQHDDWKSYISWNCWRSSSWTEHL